MMQCLLRPSHSQVKLLCGGVRQYSALLDVPAGYTALPTPCEHRSKHQLRRGRGGDSKGIHFL